MAFTSRNDKGAALTVAELDNNFLCHWPVGSIYMNALSDQSPRHLIGYGEWTEFAQGYVLVGADSPHKQGLPDKSATLAGTFGEDPDTNGYWSPGVTKGTPSVTLSTSEIADHSHSFIDILRTDGTLKDDGRYRLSSFYDGYFNVGSTHQTVYNRSNSSLVTGGFTTSSGGQSLPHNNLQKYITVRMWKRER